MFAAINRNRPVRKSGVNAVRPVIQFDQPVKFDNESVTGFIKHPDRFPLNSRRLRFWERRKIEFADDSNIGLAFSSAQYQKPGSIIEMTIPLRKETHQFFGKVVMVKEEETGYEIGVWLLNIEDAPKLRIIEQICHIELYLNDKRYKDGPFLSKEKITEEWISRFAGRFPVN